MTTTIDTLHAVTVAVWVCVLVIMGSNIVLVLALSFIRNRIRELEKRADILQDRLYHLQTVSPYWTIYAGGPNDRKTGLVWPTRGFDESVDFDMHAKNSSTVIGRYHFKVVDENRRAAVFRFVPATVKEPSGD